MEHIGVIPEGEWSSLNGMYSEDAEFMAQLLGNCSLPNEVLNDTNFLVSPTFWPTQESNRNFSVVDETAIYSSDETNTSSMCSLSQGISGYSGGSSILFPFSSQESYYSTLSHHVSMTNNNLMTMDYCAVEGKNGSQVHSANVMAGDNDFLNQDVSNDSIHSNNDIKPEDVREGKKLEFTRGLVVPIPPQVPREDKIISPSESKKRSRVPCDVPRNDKKMKYNKCPKFDDSDDDNNNNNSNAVFHRQNSSSCCSEDESNASLEMNGTTSCSSSKGSRALNSSGKTRASRGSATDPQSLYARKRRERINERLKVLQTLVPNGTKVDISTMLEEAVEYVKFLQLQIKLLSSDDHWMYAPIAYNGMDIGLDIKISTPKPQS